VSPTLMEWPIRVCPRCGRSDRYHPLKDRHFSQGKRCDGKPVELVAVAQIPNGWDSK
jgi:hypothetical protein